MKKKFVCLLLLLLSICLIATNFENLVPYDVDYALRFTNVESGFSRLAEMTENRFITIQRFAELGKGITSNAEILIYGDLHMDPGLMELRLDNLDIKDVLGIFLNQKIAMITNMIPYEFIIDLIEAQLRNSIEQSGLFYSDFETLEGKRVTNYAIDILEKTPPTIGNLYLYRDDEKIIVSSDKELMVSTLKAEADTNYRLYTHSQEFAELMKDSESFISWYNQGALTSWYLFRLLRLDYPQPESEAVKIFIDNEGNIEIKSNINLYFRMVDESLSIRNKNKPIEYFEKLPVPDGVDTLFSTTGYLLNLDPLLDLIEDFFDLPKFPNLSKISELLFYQKLFRNFGNHSSIWFELDNPEDYLYMLIDTYNVKEAIDAFAKIVDGETKQEKNIYYISSRSMYLAGLEGENWFELSTIFPDKEKVPPLRNYVPEMIEIYPEIIEEVRSAHGEVAHLIFSENRIRFFGYFDNEGDLNLDLRITIDSARKFAAQLDFTPITIKNFNYSYDKESLKTVLDMILSNDLAKLKSEVNALFNFNYPLDQMANTAIHIAAQNGLPEIVAYLLEKRARSDMPNFEGQTPLHLAVLSGSRDIVILLIENGVDINRKDMYGKTPLLDSCITDNAVIAELLIENGAIADIVDERGFAPLMAAVQNSNFSLVKLIVDSGVNINTRDAQRNSPLSFAEKSGNKEIADFLKENGAIE